MIVRLTQKLATKVKVGGLASLPLDEEAIFDWSTQSFMIGRSQYLLISNTKTLYSCVTPSKGVNNMVQLVARLISVVQDSLACGGFTRFCDQLAATDPTTARFAKSLNRSVTGSMNELIGVATNVINFHEVALPDLNADLNDTLLSLLASGKDKYGKPRKAMEELLSTVRIEG